MLEARDQFIARHRGSSERTDNGRAGVIRNLSGLEGCRIASKRKSKDGDRSIAGTGDVEYIARFGGDVMRMLALFKKHNALLAEGDEQILGAPFLNECFSGAHKVDVLFWRKIAVPIWNAGGEKCFGTIWFDRCHTTPIDQIVRIWIGRYDFLGGAGIPCDLGT